LEKSFEGYKIFLLHAPKKVLFEEDICVQSFKITKVPILGLPLRSPKKKCHLDVAQQRVTKYIIGRGMMPPPKACGLCKTCA
jgi:hypothetical protein